MDRALREGYVCDSSALGTGKLTDVSAGKWRTISWSALANSRGRRAGDPKQACPPSMAGSQKQLFSTGKQRKAVTGRPAKRHQQAKTTAIGQVRIAEH